jgi:hypothetical protein
VKVFASVGMGGATGIRAGVAEALHAIAGREPDRLDGPPAYALEGNTTTIATTCECIPGVGEAMPVIGAPLPLALRVGQKEIHG